MVIKIAEIKESVWICFIVAVGFELYVKGLMGQAESTEVSEDSKRSTWYSGDGQVYRMVDFQYMLEFSGSPRKRQSSCEVDANGIFRSAGRALSESQERKGSTRATSHVKKAIKNKIHKL